MKHQGTTCLQTSRLLLRPFQKEDIPFAFANWMHDPKVTKYLRWPPHADITVTKTVIEEWIRHYDEPTFYQWAIVVKALQEPIGTISVVKMDEKTESVHIGYCIGSDWWHQGYTTEAFLRIITFFFHEVQVQRIESQHDPRNVNSGKVMKACGLHFEGCLRKADWSNQGIVDACVYGLLKDEYIR